jgi:hypothetical protein
MDTFVPKLYLVHSDFGARRAQSYEYEAVFTTRSPRAVGFADGAITLRVVLEVDKSYPQQSSGIVQRLGQDGWHTLSTNRGSSWVDAAPRPYGKDAAAKEDWCEVAAYVMAERGYRIVRGLATDSPHERIA